jgi:hypothetical protein
MVPASFDAGFVYHQGERQPSAGRPGTCTILPDGLVALQVDDSFVSGSPAFLREELEKIAQFQCKIATDIISPYCRFSSA